MYILSNNAQDVFSGWFNMIVTSFSFLFFSFSFLGGMEWCSLQLSGDMRWNEMENYADHYCIFFC